MKPTLLIALLLLLCLGVAEAKTTKKKTTAHAATATSHSRSGHSRKTTSHSPRTARSKTSKSHVRGQAAPDSDRTREIQTALIREHYLTGEPSGSWDAPTRAALTRYQADHGWQSKVVPDSRALIKLGLGPSREGLLNPDTAAISPHELGAANPQPGGSASN